MERDAGILEAAVDFFKIFECRSVNRYRATKPLQHSVDGNNTGGIRAALVDDDLARQTIGRERPGEELCCCSLFAKNGPYGLS